MDTAFGYVAGYPASVNGGFHVGWDYPTPVGVPAVACRTGVIVGVGASVPLVPLHLPTEGLAGYEWVATDAWGVSIALQVASDLIVDYCHLSAIAMGITLNVGVAAGELLGATGATGLVTGPHLHLNVRRLFADGVWRRVDPASVGMIG